VFNMSGRWSIPGGLAYLHGMRVFDLVRNLSPNALTVLNYHRIDDPERSGFDTYLPNVSATPLEFARQMDYVAENYRVLSGAELADCIERQRKLPPHSAVITFDDGYYDNYSNAYPVLKARKLSAIIFLATGYIGKARPFYWDLLSYCFSHTRLGRVELPYLGVQHIDTVTLNRLVLGRWIAFLKSLPEDEKQLLTEQTPRLLDVHVPELSFQGIMMDRLHIKEMSSCGIEFGGHTVNHPILTRIPFTRANSEIEGSKQMVEEITGQPALSFAYPNGQVGDFNYDLETCVRDVGYKFAFSLLPGPTGSSNVFRGPFAIRRIFISYKDSFPRFVAKLTGLGRIKSL
jgi:peptidoglycan/xylan/chitin deacetylase (PgdA/CDA1 family)